MNVSEERPPRKSVLLSFRFLTVSVIGSFAMAITSVYADLPALVALLGALVSILAGLALEAIHQAETHNNRQNKWFAQLQVPVLLASDANLTERYVELSEALARLSKCDDEVLREVALIRLAVLTNELTAISTGSVVFDSTETWRTVYEKLLRADDVSEYLSVAWVRTADYWQDTPGRQSTELNLQRAHEGLLIERLAIVNDTIWPPEAALPDEPIRRWLLDQHEHGMRILLVRESQLKLEPELIVDYGIYGNRAVGYQELDDQSRTKRFTLRFDHEEIQLAKDRWQRLKLYAIPLWKILDRRTGTP